LRFWKTSVTQRPGAPGLRSTREHSQPGGRRVELDESHTESAGDLRRYVLRVSTSAGLRGMAGICWVDPLLAYHLLVRDLYGSALGEPRLPRLSPRNTPVIFRCLYAASTADKGLRQQYTSRVMRTLLRRMR